MVESRYGSHWPVVEASGEHLSDGTSHERKLVMDVSVVTMGPFTFGFLLRNRTLTEPDVLSLQDLLPQQVAPVTDVRISQESDFVAVTFRSDEHPPLIHAVHAAVVIGSQLRFAPARIQLMLDYDPEGVPFEVGEHWPAIVEAIKAERGEATLPQGFLY